MILAALVLIPMTSALISGSESQTTGVIPSTGAALFPFDDVRYVNADVHDPSIIAWNGTYVMVATSGFEFCPMWTSSDLVHWQSKGPALNIAPAWLQAAVPQHRSVWAPDPVKVGNDLRLYYCASQRFGDNTSFIGFAQNSNFDPHHATEGWVDHGSLIESHSGTSNFNAIDPDVMTGPDGRQWMAFGSYWTGIYLSELDPVTGKLRHPDQAPIHLAVNPAERNNPLEAATQCYHQGYYYLFVTYGLAAQGIRSTYRMVVGRSQNPEGPYVGFTGTPMLEGGHTDLLKSSPPMIGPGGGNVFQDTKGNWNMAFHYYDATRHWHGDIWGRPTLQVRPITWGADGWPLPGLPIGIVPKGHLHSTPLGEWVYQRNFSNPEPLTFTKEGHCRHGDRLGEWNLVKDQLHIHWLAGEKADSEDRETLVLDDSKQYFVGRDLKGNIVRGIRKDAQVQRL